MKTSKIITFLIFGILVIGAVTSIMAENATPPDKLYWIKTGINEDIKEFLSPGNVRKAKLQLDLIKERVNEKEELIKNYRFTSSSINTINSKIEKHVTKFMEYTQKVQINWQQEDYQILQTRFNSLMNENTYIDSIFQENSNTGTINNENSDGMINENIINDKSSTWVESDNSSHSWSESIEDTSSTDSQLDSFLHKNHYT